MTEKAQMCLLHCQHIQHCYIATRATSLFLPGDLCYWWPRRYEHTSQATTAAADLESCEQKLLYLWLVSTPRPVLSSLSDPWHCASFKPDFCVFANFDKTSSEYAPFVYPGKWQQPFAEMQYLCWHWLPPEFILALGPTLPPCRPWSWSCAPWSWSPRSQSTSKPSWHQDILPGRGKSSNQREGCKVWTVF